MKQNTWCVAIGAAYLLTITWTPNWDAYAVGNDFNHVRCWHGYVDWAGRDGICWKADEPQGWTALWRVVRNWLHSRGPSFQRAARPL